ncbi:MAG: NfeD family protein [Candidatus Dactylopiibacterium sp.]|nr:NfeD family protein [Candidatus Dactylopiibacterium sp.]
MSVQWWYWIVLGCVLCLAELAVPALILIWLGLAALITGVLVLVLPLSLTLQLVFWGALSVALTVVFLRYFRSRGSDAGPGHSAEAIGEIGLVTRAAEPYVRGEILFQKPVLGADRWPCVADAPISQGARARVVAVEGSALRVEAG